MCIAGILFWRRSGVQNKNLHWKSFIVLAKKKKNRFELRFSCVGKLFIFNDPAG